MEFLSSGKELLYVGLSVGLSVCWSVCRFLKKNLEDSNLHFYDTYVTDFWYALPGDVPEDK